MSSRTTEDKGQHPNRDVGVDFFGFGHAGRHKNQGFENARRADRHGHPSGGRVLATRIDLSLSAFGGTTVDI